jgi:hypothetical protein
MIKRKLQKRLMKYFEICLFFRFYLTVSGLNIFNCKIDSPTCFTLNRDDKLNDNWSVGLQVED